LVRDLRDKGTHKQVACVASVSVRLSARSMHFSLFWPLENWGGRKKAPLPFPAASISVALAPIFVQPQSEKRLQREERACYAG